MDSDFDIDENDDVIEMEEDDDEKRKRRSAYKPPTRHEDKKPVKSIVSYLVIKNESVFNKKIFF